MQVPQGYERWMSTPRFERIRRIYRSDSAEGPIGGVLERISRIELDYSGQTSGGDRLCPMGILRERCNFRTQFVGERRLWRMRRYDRFWLWIQPVMHHHTMSRWRLRNSCECTARLQGATEGQRDAHWPPRKYPLTSDSVSR